MSELFFTLKCLVLAIFITIGMQVKIGKVTIEEKFLDLVQVSAEKFHLQEVSSGGVLFIQNTLQSTRQFIESKTDIKSGPQKASRLNFEIKRSEAVEKSTATSQE